MARSTADAFNIVRCLDHNGKLDDSPQDKKQKAATPCSRDEVYRQDFAGPIFLRASRVLGPISRFRIVEILPHMKLASRASRPGLTVGFLRILCNGLCTAQRFPAEGNWWISLNIKTPSPQEEWRGEQELCFSPSPPTSTTMEGS